MSQLDSVVVGREEELYVLQEKKKKMGEVVFPQDLRDKTRWGKYHSQMTQMLACRWKSSAEGDMGGACFPWYSRAMNAVV